MTLDEIFEKYPDDALFYRPIHLERLVEHRPDLTRDYLLKAIGKSSGGWLRFLKTWGNQECRDMGFIIPQFMIEDANADDWELYTEDE